MWKEIESFHHAKDCTIEIPCTCCFRFSKEQVKVIKFCRGLNEKYIHVRSHIMLIEPPPILSIALSLVLLVQEHRLNILSFFCRMIKYPYLL